MDSDNRLDGGLPVADDRIITEARDVLSLEEEHLGVSDWLVVDQARVDRFADAVDDHQWIHCDPERATRDGPFGGTIAHGALTLSLVSTLRERIRGIRIEIPAKMGVLYGYDRVRFASPVPVGSRIRLTQKLVRAEMVKPAVLQMVFAETVEIEGADRPALVIEAINRKYL